MDIYQTLQKLLVNIVHNFNRNICFNDFISLQFLVVGDSYDKIKYYTKITLGREIYVLASNDYNLI